MKKFAVSEWQRNAWPSDYVCFEYQFVFAWLVLHHISVFVIFHSIFFDEYKSWTECSIEYHKFITMCSTPISALPELTSLAKNSCTFSYTRDHLVFCSTPYNFGMKFIQRSILLLINRWAEQQKKSNNRQSWKEREKNKQIKKRKKGIDE